MKNLLCISAILLIISSPLAAQTGPSEITLESVFIELAYNGDLENVKKFISAGTPVDSVVADKSTALMWAAFNGHIPVVAHLLEKGAQVDAKDANGRTALLYASSGPSSEMVGLLLRHGADVNTQGQAEGFTPLMMAAAEGHIEVVRVLLLNGATAEITDKDGDTAEKFARDNGHTAVLNLLMNQADRGGPP